MESVLEGTGQAPNRCRMSVPEELRDDSLHRGYEAEAHKGESVIVIPQYGVGRWA
jgi:hypothetical protein